MRKKAEIITLTLMKVYHSKNIYFAIRLCVNHFLWSGNFTVRLVARPFLAEIPGGCPTPSPRRSSNWGPPNYRSVTSCDLFGSFLLWNFLERMLRVSIHFLHSLENACLAFPFWGYTLGNEKFLFIAKLSTIEAAFCVALCVLIVIGRLFS